MPDVSRIDANQLGGRVFEIELADSARRPSAPGRRDHSSYAVETYTVFFAGSSRHRSLLLELEPNSHLSEDSAWRF